ncbi:MAG: site-specific integrase [Eubacteriales bacterium]|nr:site-specific integrase [Eubacteriales bacterium]
MPKQYKYTKSFTFEGKRYVVRADTEKDAIIKMANRLRDLEEGKVTINNSMTVNQWAEICINDYKTNLRPISLNNYKSKMNKWIVGNIGDLKLKDVKPLHCQKILNDMDGMAKDSINKINQMMNFIFDKAVQNKLILENPAKYLTLPEGTKSTRRAITSTERTTLLQVADINPKYTYFLFMLLCGCRPSEVANIKGMDIQIIKGTLMLHIRGTKTVNADRMVPIPKYLQSRLPDVGKFEFMFTNENGKPLTTGNRNTLWKHLRRDMNIALGCKIYRNELIPPFPLAADLVPYCFRHTYCTDLQKKGIDIRTAQYLMGHADISLTANIYTHTDYDTLVEVASTIEKDAKKVLKIAD